MNISQSQFLIAETLLLWWLFRHFLRVELPVHPDYGSGGSQGDFRRRGSKVLFQDKNRTLRVTVYQAGKVRKYFIQFGQFTEPNWRWETRDLRRILQEWDRLGYCPDAWRRMYRSLFYIYFNSIDQNTGISDFQEWQEQVEVYCNSLSVPGPLRNLLEKIRFRQVPHPFEDSLRGAIAAGVVAEEDFEPETFAWLMGAEERLKKLVFLRGEFDHSLMCSIKRMESLSIQS